MNIPLNIDWQQILLHLLNFVILAGGLYFLLYQARQGLHGQARGLLSASRRTRPQQTTRRRRS